MNGLCIRLVKDMLRKTQPKFMIRLCSLLILANFLLSFSHVSRGQTVDKYSLTGANVSQATVAFTPGQAALSTIKDALSQAQSTVDVAMFRLTQNSLVDALCYLASERKLKVRVFLNQDNQRLADGASEDPDDGTVSEVEPSYESIYQKLIRNGVAVYASTGKNKMHLRCAVIDGQTVITGSCNWVPQSFKEPLIKARFSARRGW